MDSSGSNAPSLLHFVVVPFMAQGHFIPLVDISRLLARRHVSITIFATTYNIPKIKDVITRDVTCLGSRISIVEMKLPWEAAGLPQGCESVDMLDWPTGLMQFFEAGEMLEEQVEEVMKKMNPPPNCLIGDMILPFTKNIASRFNIPKLIFHGFSCFSLLGIHLLRKSGILDSIESQDEYFELPGFLNKKVQFLKPQVSVLQTLNGNIGKLNEATNKIIEADYDSYGVIVNTFEELEGEYVKEFKKERGGKVWCIGPVSLCNKSGLDKAERGHKAVIDEDHCLQWLDSKEPGSVLYVCLGSLCNLLPAQLREIGRGLEESDRPFMWVIRQNENYRELIDWISDSGFEERIKERGVVIKGWAPQVLILSHASIGGFLTHCGWNSTLEGITAGVPLLTWPLFAEQFYNEKLVVEILNVGITIGAKKVMEWGKEEEIGVTVDKDSVRERVDELMSEKGEGGERRRRAKELGELANKAFEEGGSSHRNLTLLVDDIMELAKSKI